MDRVKALRRATAAVIVVVGCALVLSCSSDNDVVGGRSVTYDSPGDIYGTVTGPYGAISGATVTWVCEDFKATLGADDTDNNGDYLITSEAWWTSHDTHRLKGRAVKEGYEDGTSDIESYDHAEDWERDFYLEPSR